MSQAGAGFPWYFAIEQRLVKVVAPPEGGMDVLVLNPATGALEHDISYLARCFEPGQAVERLSETEFHERAAQLKAAAENEVE